MLTSYILWLIISGLLITSGVAITFFHKKRKAKIARRFEVVFKLPVKPNQIIKVFAAGIDNTPISNKVIPVKVIKILSNEKLLVERILHKNG
jgi:hypothetical protein